MPLDQSGIQSTFPPTACGGNLDCKDLIEGSTLFLPIAVDGGLFFTGDDGTRLAFFAQSVEGKVGLWVRALNSTHAQQLIGNETGAFPFGLQMRGGSLFSLKEDWKKCPPPEGPYK
jgi:hypothetical protein